MSNERPTASAEVLIEQCIDEYGDTIPAGISINEEDDLRRIIGQALNKWTEQLRKELAIAEEAARLGKLSIHEQFLATNKMAETIVENQRLTAEVEKLKQRVESAYKAGWESAYHKGQRQHESFEEWKASRGKGSGDQPNAG